MKPQDENRKLREYVRQSKLRRRWHGLTAVLATAAAVLTLCVMVLPAVTLENTPQALACQLDLHIVEPDAQLFGQAQPNLAPAAAELPADANDQMLLHKSTASP